MRSQAVLALGRVRRRSAVSAAAASSPAAPRRGATVALGLLAALLVLSALAACTPAARADPSAVGLCVRNCAQCKKMFGAYFEGQLCADSCVKFKGKLVPDCEDFASIAPFLNKLE